MFSKSRILFSLVVVAMLVPKVGRSQGHVEATVNEPAKIVSRSTPVPGRSIITRNGDAVLMLNDNAIVIQMTDEALHSLGRSEPEETRSGFGRLVGAMVMAGVRSMLDRGISYPLSEIDHASVQGSRLLVVSNKGDLVFDTMDINNAKPMHDFDGREAAAFARKINAAIRRAR